jgi:hypothetical protein
MTATCSSMVGKEGSEDLFGNIGGDRVGNRADKWVDKHSKSRKEERNLD